MSNLIVHSSSLKQAISRSGTIYDYISEARSQLEKFKSDATANANSWENKYYSKHVGKSECSVDTSSFHKYTYDDEGNKIDNFDSDAYKTACEKKAKEWVAKQKKLYIDAMENLLSKVPDALRKADSVRNSLKELQAAKNSFDCTSVNIEKIYADLDKSTMSGEGFSWGTDYYIDEKTGRKVEYKFLYKEGKEGQKIHLNEEVNCAVTNIGAMSDTVVALASNYSNAMTPEEFDLYLNKSLEATAATNAYYLEKGYFSISDEAAIAELYRVGTGLEYDKDTVLTEYNSIIAGYLRNSEEQGDYLASLVSAGVVGPFGIAGLIGSMISEHGELSDEEKEKYGLGRYVKRSADSLKIEEFEGYGDVTVHAMDIHELGGGTTVAGAQGTVESIVSEQLFESTEDIAASLEEIPNTVVKNLEKELGVTELEEITELDLPKKIEDNALSSNDIDRQVANEYLKQYEIDSNYENSGRLIEEYNGMTKQEKVEALQELGYRDDVITDIVTNGTAGVTAYVIGHQNIEMANVSNQVAIQQGTVGLDTINVDSAQYFKNVGSSDLAIQSMQIQQARTSLNSAKITYDNAITVANNAIDDANDAKEEYTRKVQAIKKKSGDDPSNWSDKDVEDYNEVTNKYNKAVERANEAASKVEIEKSNYESKKADYETAKSNYANEVRNNIEGNLKAGNGIVESSSTVGGTDSATTQQNTIQVSQTMTGVGENGELVTETRVTFENPDDFIVPDLNGVVVDGIDASTIEIQPSVNADTGPSLEELQQMQQYAAIITEQEAKQEVKLNDNMNIETTPDLVGVTVQ